MCLKKLGLGFLLLVFSIKTYAQDDLLNQLDSLSPKEKIYTTSTFKGTRLINGHTIENGGAKTLDFRIAHRFANIKNNKNETIQEVANRWFGLDGPASLALSFDYNFNGKLVVGIARNNIDKLYEVYAKYRILSQTEDDMMPISATLLGKVGYLSDMNLKEQDQNYKEEINKLMYLWQALIARKFNEKLSLQLSPIFIHYNYTGYEGQINNDIYAAMGSGRYKFTRSMAITAEYSHVFNTYYDSQIMLGKQYVPTFSFGVDIETGGHVFQMFFSNANTISEFQYLAFNTNDWGNGAFRWGFNVSRTFGFKKLK